MILCLELGIDVLNTSGGALTPQASSADLIVTAGKTRWIRYKSAGAWTTLGGEL